MSKTDHDFHEAYGKDLEAYVESERNALMLAFVPEALVGLATMVEVPEPKHAGPQAVWISRPLFDALAEELTPPTTTDVIGLQANGIEVFVAAKLPPGIGHWVDRPRCGCFECCGRRLLFLLGGGRFQDLLPKPPRKGRLVVASVAFHGKGALEA